MSDTAAVTDWISATSTGVLGVLGVLITGWQWTRSKFRPFLTARIDQQHEAIELRIVNKGRAAGIIDQVDVVCPDHQILEDVVFEGFDGGKFRPFALPPMASARVIVQAPESDTFPRKSMLVVGIGRSNPRELYPTVLSNSYGLFGLRSVLPPGTNA